MGYAESFAAGGKDIWMIKLDTFGNVVWEMPFGGSDDIDFDNNLTIDYADLAILKSMFFGSPERINLVL